MNAIDPADVREALERVLASPSFANSGRLSRMLRFVVDRTLAGQGGELKEYLVGVEVFDRPVEYDPRLDSIVRVEARRLRSKLAEHYAAEGAADPIRILLAKGGYTPAFERASTSSGSSPMLERRPAVVLEGRSRPLLIGIAVVLLVALSALSFWTLSARSPASEPAVTVAVLPFHVFSGREDDRRLADRLTDGVTTELARVPAFGVASYTSASQYRDPQGSLGEIGQALGVAVVMEATAHVDGSIVRLEVRMVDTERGRKLWVDDFSATTQELDLLERQVAGAAAAFLRSRYSRQ